MTYGELKTLVEEFIENSEASFINNLSMFVRLCEEDINRKVQIPNQRTSDTVAATIGSALVPFPSGFLAALSVSKVIDSRAIPLLPKTAEFITELNSELDDGEPRFYSIYDADNFCVSPIPDAAYDIEVSYISEPTSLTDGENDANETWLSTNAQNAILYGTILQGYIYTKGDQDVIASYQAEYNKALEALKVLVEGRQRKDAFRRPEIRLPV